MSNRVLTTLVAFTLAATATLAVFLYLRGVADEAETGADLVEVVISNEDIPAGTPLDELVSSGAFTTQQIPADALVDGAITSLSQLEGEETSAAVLAGEQISTARLQGSGALPGGSLGIPANHQALTLAITAPQGVGGEIHRNDRVVIYATFDRDVDNPVTVTLVPEVEVLDVSTGSLQGDATTSTEMLITMALRPKDAQRVAYAKERGAVYLALIPPGEDGTPNAPITIRQVVR